ncbi:MAG TPA: hypothetical protein VL971_08760, partial [Rhizomicrobium sp.]|nr:hypothetical protein [Rhizomicrobium sp.]
GIARCVFRRQADEQIALDVGFPRPVDVMRIEALGLAAIAAIDIGAGRRVRRASRDRDKCRRCEQAFYRVQETRAQTSTMRRSSVM